MSPTPSSRRSRRSPNPVPKSSPNASCSRANQAPPMPSTALPPERWSSVVAIFGRVARVAERCSRPPSGPAGRATVRAATAASAKRPLEDRLLPRPEDRLGGGPTSRPSSQPPASAASAASRKSSQLVAWLQSWAPNRSSLTKPRDRGNERGRIRNVTRCWARKRSMLAATRAGSSGCSAGRGRRCPPGPRPDRRRSRRPRRSSPTQR